MGWILCLLPEEVASQRLDFSNRSWRVCHGLRRIHSLFFALPPFFEKYCGAVTLAVYALGAQTADRSTHLQTRKG